MTPKTNNPPNNSTGFIDLHCHLLPGIDDGCISFDETLASIRRLMEHGFVGSVCTPHFLHDIYPDITPEFVEDRVDQLREQLHENGIEYQLWAGAEVRIAANTIRWFESCGVPTLGESRCVLVDFWDDHWPSYADRVIDYLLDHRYQPILAHPERMGLDIADLQYVVNDLTQKGVRFQGNFNSVSGGEGRTAQEKMRLLFDDACYFVLATDTHHTDDLPSRMAGVEMIRDEHGHDAVSMFLGQRPREILFYESG